MELRVNLFGRQVIAREGNEQGRDAFLGLFKDTQQQHQDFLITTQNSNLVRNRFAAEIDSDMARGSRREMPQILPELTIKYTMQDTSLEEHSFELPLSVAVDQDQGRPQATNALLDSIFTHPTTIFNKIITYFNQDRQTHSLNAPVFPVGFVTDLDSVRYPERWYKGYDADTFRWSLMQRAYDLLSREQDTEVNRKIHELFYISRKVHQVIYENTSSVRIPYKNKWEVWSAVTRVSALEIALRMHLISPEQYAAVTERLHSGAAKKHTIVRLQGYTGSKDGGACDDQQTVYHVLEGVNKIAEAIATGESLDTLEETEIITIPSFQSGGGYVPDGLIAQAQSKTQYQGWLYEEARIYKQLLLELGIPESDQTASPNSRFTFEGDSRGAFIAWRLANEFDDLSKNLILKKPVGFYRGVEKFPNRHFGLSPSSLLASTTSVVKDAGDTKKSRHERVKWRFRQDANCDASQHAEENEFLTDCTIYIPAPKSRTKVILPTNDTLVFPFYEAEKIDKTITDNDVRMGVYAQFNRPLTQVIWVEGDHKLPVLQEEEIRSEVKWSHEIARQAPWLIPDYRGCKIEIYPKGDIQHVLFTASVS